MTSLVPRLFDFDLSEWFELDPIRRGNLIRVEDQVTDTEYTVRAELPGMDPAKDIQVSVTNGVLNIHAERKEETQARYRTEFRYGALHRSVRLPGNADESKIAARYANGILEVTVALKPSEPAGKQIEIKAA